MKNQFLLLLLSCFFLFGNVSFAHADESGLDGVTIAVIHNGKTGEAVFSFHLPEKYFNKDGSLVFPLEITFTQNSKSAIFSIQTKNLSIELPSTLSGTYNVLVRVEDYMIRRSISF